METITNKRIEFLKSLDEKDLYSDVTWKGPRGEKNAKICEGWAQMPTSGWTRAAHLAGLESMQMWEGWNKKSSRWFPEKLIDEMEAWDKRHQGGRK